MTTTARRQAALVVLRPSKASRPPRIEQVADHKILLLANLRSRGATARYRRLLGLPQVEWRIIARLGNMPPMGLTELAHRAGRQAGLAIDSRRPVMFHCYFVSVQKRVGCHGRCRSFRAEGGPCHRSSPRNRWDQRRRRQRREDQIGRCGRDHASNADRRLVGPLSQSRVDRPTHPRLWHAGFRRSGQSRRLSGCHDLCRGGRPRHRHDRRIPGAHDRSRDEPLCRTVHPAHGAAWAQLHRGRRSHPGRGADHPLGRFRQGAQGRPALPQMQCDRRLRARNAQDHQGSRRTSQLAALYAYRRIPDAKAGASSGAGGLKGGGKG